MTSLTRKEKLRRLVERDLGYEIRMLFETYRLAADVPLGPNRTALIESFCLHARALHEFLTDKSGTGVHAKHVTDGYKAFANGPINPTISRLLSSHVAHLSLNRSTDTGKLIRRTTRNMLVIGLADELMVLHQHLRPEHRTPWLIEVISDGYRLKHSGGSIDLHVK